MIGRNPFILKDSEKVFRIFKQMHTHTTIDYNNSTRTMPSVQCWLSFQRERMANAMLSCRKLVLDSYDTEFWGRFEAWVVWYLSRQLKVDKKVELIKTKFRQYRYHLICLYILYVCRKSFSLVKYFKSYVNKLFGWMQKKSWFSDYFKPGLSGPMSQINSLTNSEKNSVFPLWLDIWLQLIKCVLNWNRVMNSSIGKYKNVFIKSFCNICW